MQLCEDCLKNVYGNLQSGDFFVLYAVYAQVFKAKEIMKRNHVVSQKAIFMETCNTKNISKAVGFSLTKTRMYLSFFVKIGAVKIIKADHTKIYLIEETGMEFLKMMKKDKQKAALLKTIAEKVKENA